MRDLLELTFDLVSIESVSRNEAALSQRMERELRSAPGFVVERVDDNLVARTDAGREARVVIAGHLDTVPPFTSEAPRVEGETLWGLGAVDMKGGLAVMLDLVSVAADANVDLTLVFYVCEEIERSANGLLHISRVRPELLKADAAVLVEPTGGAVEAGCQGTMRAVVTLGGRRAHTARPGQGVNAIHRLATTLETLSSYMPRTVELDGCAYTEQLQAVGVSGGIAPNVVPDRASLTVNHRFAPDRSAGQAESELRELLGAGLERALGDRVDIADLAEGAPPSLGDPLLARLATATDVPPRGKLGWTDVATFHSLGTPASNFGPGDPLLAHTADEHVSREELEHARGVLTRLVCG